MSENKLADGCIDGVAIANTKVEPKKPITIEQLQVLRERLQLEMRACIERFERESGMRVRDLNVSRAVDFVSLDGRSVCKSSQFSFEALL